jgi:hypothetical protein
MRYSGSQQHFDEAPLRMDERRIGQQDPASTEISLQYLRDEYPAGFNDNWEYDRQFHTCWLCGKPGMDEGMHKNNIGYWVHDTCELEMLETIKYLKY